MEDARGFWAEGETEAEYFASWYALLCIVKAYVAAKGDIYLREKCLLRVVENGSHEGPEVRDAMAWHRDRLVFMAWATALLPRPL